MIVGVLSLDSFGCQASNPSRGLGMCLNVSNLGSMEDHKSLVSNIKQITEGASLISSTDIDFYILSYIYSIISDKYIILLEMFKQNMTFSFSFELKYM